MHRGVPEAVMEVEEPKLDCCPVVVGLCRKSKTCESVARAMDR